MTRRRRSGGSQRARVALTGLAFVAAITGCSQGVNWNAALASSHRALRATGRPDAAALTVKAFDQYGSDVATNPRGADRSGLPSLMVRVLSSNYQVVVDTVMHGSSGERHACPNPVAPVSTNHAKPTVGDPRLLALAIGGIGLAKDRSSLQTLIKVATAAAAPPGDRQPGLAPVVALGFVVASADSQVGRASVLLSQHDLGALNNWAANVYPPGLPASAQEELSIEANRALDQGRYRATACLRKLP